jgi:AcrR family transcriptional regulator
MDTAVGPRGAKLALLLKAEELFADSGVEAVSPREIVIATGLKNMSAVGYHFGGKDGLIQAILRYRMPPINDRRLDILARRAAVIAGDDQTAVAHALVEAMVLPLAETMVAPGGRHYLRMLARLAASRRLSIAQIAEAEYGTGWMKASAGLNRLLSVLPRPLRDLRFRLLLVLIVQSLGDWCEGEHRDDLIAPAPLMIDGLIEAGVALLLADPSPALLHQAAQAAAVDPPRA